jgi:hypothetical protein
MIERHAERQLFEELAFSWVIYQVWPRCGIEP